MTIRPPRSTPDHPDHIKDCEEALEDALAAVERDAALAGWEPATIAAALLNLAKAQVMALQANAETDAAIVKAQRRQ